MCTGWNCDKRRRLRSLLHMTSLAHAMAMAVAGAGHGLPTTTYGVVLPWNILLQLTFCICIGALYPVLLVYAENHHCWVTVLWGPLSRTSNLTIEVELTGACSSKWPNKFIASPTMLRSYNTGGSLRLLRQEGIRVYFLNLGENRFYAG